MTYTTKTATVNATKALLLTISVLAGLFVLLFTVLAAIAESVSLRAIEGLYQEPLLDEDVLHIDPISASVEAAVTLVFDSKEDINGVTRVVTNEVMNFTEVAVVKVSEMGYREALKLARSMGAKFSKQPKTTELQDWFDGEYQEIVEDAVYGTEGDLESGLEQAMTE